MLTGELRSQVDRLWNAFWSGGISNPLEVIEQITYLLFIKRLDELHTKEEKKSNRLGKPIENAIYKKNKQHLRWSRFRDLAPKEMFKVVDKEVFPFIQEAEWLDGKASAYMEFMSDARFSIPKPELLAKAVEMIDALQADDLDTKGDLYEYMLSKIASAGQNGQFRTPRHIIKMMVAMIDPKPTDIICDPACGTGGFLMASAEHIREHYEDMLTKAENRRHFNNALFNGYDFDNTMLRIGSMNMLLHGVENPDIHYRDSLSQENAQDSESYSVILANPPFKGSLDYEATAKNLLDIVETKKTELLFLALFLRMLKPGGRAAVIVPDGVLFGSSNAHKSIRNQLIEKQKLDAVISMPSGVFKPYAGVSTAILLFTKTDSGGTDKVWFYDMQADGFSLDDKRTELDSSKHENNNIPDIIKRWKNRKTESKRERTEQSFFVDKKEIAESGYDLSINRYKQVEHDTVDHKSPKDIIKELKAIEAEIQRELTELEAML